MQISISPEGDVQKRVAPPNIESAWYVIHAYSRHEAKVELALQQKGFEVFLPRIVVPSCRYDRRILLEVPLFPGYLFVRTILEPAAYYDIIKPQGVVRLLGGAGGPSPLPPEMVDSIQNIVNSGRHYYPGSYLKKGMQVCIADGPLAGTVGIIQGRRGKKRRLLVAVELFQRAVMVELEEESVEPWS